MSIVSKQIKTIYISGAISSDPDYEEKFSKAKSVLMGMGYNVLNPCDFVTAKEITESGINEDLAYRLCLERDFQAIMFMADAVVDLCDWQKSKGAIAENYLAQFLGIPCYEYNKFIIGILEPLDKGKLDFNFRDLNYGI